LRHIAAAAATGPVPSRHGRAARGPHLFDQAAVRRAAASLAALTLCDER
jgi:hypothetical protein